MRAISEQLSPDIDHLEGDNNCPVSRYKYFTLHSWDYKSLLKPGLAFPVWQDTTISSLADWIMLLVRTLRKNSMYNLHKNVYLFLKIVVLIRFLFIICDISRDESKDLVSYLKYHLYKQQTLTRSSYKHKQLHQVPLISNLNVSLPTPHHYLHMKERIAVSWRNYSPI